MGRPLTSDQIEAADSLHEHLPQWKRVDAALLALRVAFPTFDEPSCLLKAAAIDRLYSTNVYAIVPVAAQLVELIEAVDLETAGPKLVEEIALYNSGASSKRHVSFASKFAHFFIDEQRFPILDSYAEDMVTLHLGRERAQSGPGFRYVAFVENVLELKRRAGWGGSLRSVDHYLWIAGQLRAAKTAKGSAQLNREMRELIEGGSERVRQLIARVGG